jgi:hypothetical protein
MITLFITAISMRNHPEEYKYVKKQEKNHKRQMNVEPRAFIAKNVRRIPNHGCTIRL